MEEDRLSRNESEQRSVDRIGYSRSEGEPLNHAVSNVGAHRRDTDHIKDLVCGKSYELFKLLSALFTSYSGAGISQ